MNIRHLLAATVTFASLGGTAGLANAPQPGVAAANTAHPWDLQARTTGLHAVSARNRARGSTAEQNPERMTAAERRAHRKDLGIHFVKKGAQLPASR